jgi:multiple sugar transport system permease protein
MTRVKGAFSSINPPSRSAYFFVAPSILLLLAFNLTPLVASLGLSFTSATMTLHEITYVGIDNFIRIITDVRFLNSLKVTAILTLLEVPLQAFGAMVIGAMVVNNTFWNKLLRAVYFLPIVCSATVIGIMWRMILHSNVGFVTYALSMLGLGKINFLNSAQTTIFVVSFLSLWRSFGVSAIIYVTAVQQVNPSLYEAAQLDGAGRIRQFFSVTAPSIRPTFWFILMTRFAGSLQIFDIIYVTTGGGPNFSTESTVTYVYARAFASGGDMGYASAISMALFAFIMLVTVLLYRRMIREE